MKKLIWAALTLSILATASRAQETPLADVAVGYSHFHIGEFGGRFRLMESTKELHQTPASDTLTAEPEQTRRFTR